MHRNPVSMQLNTQRGPLRSRSCLLLQLPRPRPIHLSSQRKDDGYRLAVAQHGRESRLLSRGDGELVDGLDLNPSPGVSAPEGGQGRLPVLWAGIALGLVDVVGDGPELRVGQIVGKGLTLGRGPGGSARFPLLQGKLRQFCFFYKITFFFIFCRGGLTALERGTMWSMSTSLAAVQVAPS